MIAKQAGELLLPQGFKFSAMAAGIKVSGRPDLAYVEAPAGATAAAMFTTNRVVAAPVMVGRENLKSGKGRLRALLVNAGNANCATGTQGIKACKAVCAGLGRALSVMTDQVFPSSTGIIGVQLPVEKITRNLPALLGKAEASEEAARAFAQAIMTTDTRPKWESAKYSSGGKTVTVMGMAKGSGMIHPNIATMLVYLFTDAVARPAELHKFLKAAVTESFNSISVDGDTSTNDTALLMASGASGISVGKGKAAKQFSDALEQVCRSLAEQVVSDGEGVKHVVTLRIEKAKSVDDARQVARAIAHSPLVKTAWAGADPNWGRILAAAGYSGVKLDPTKMNIYFGEQQVCRMGCAYPFDEAGAHKYLSQPEYEIRVELGQGKASTRFLTCDLTAEYVHINADYST